MSDCHHDRTADLFGKHRGSDNVGSVYFADCEVTNPSVARKRRAPRVGLLGGRRKRHSSIDRFWARVQKSPDADGCWLFAGAVCNQAGHLHISRDDGSRALAHRYSYELHHGPIPAGLVVMHTCDVPRCVNPAHLTLGTQRDNIRDAIDKGRFAPWHHPNTVAARHARKGCRRDRHPHTVAHTSAVLQSAIGTGR